LAREQGRRLGMQEGFEAGRLGVFTDERVDDPAPSIFGSTQNYGYYEAGDFDNEALDSPDDSVTTEDLYLSPPRNLASIPPATNTPAPLPIPPPAPLAAPTTGRLSPIFVPFHDIHPTAIHNGAPHPRHEHINIPPDGFIPSTGPDELPHIPPPHEFSLPREPSPPRNNGSGVVEEPVISPAAFARAISPRQNGRRSPSQRAQSIRSESVRRAPSAVRVLFYI
jgi:hypothetical protein